MNETATVENKEKTNNIAEKYLIFYLEDQLFGLQGEQIIEILNMQHITYIPNPPHLINGIVNIRGKIVPLIDLKMRIGKAQKEYDELTCIILIQSEDIIAGLIVDSVKDVTDISAKDMFPISSLASDESFNRFISSICKVNDQMVLIMDAKNILRDDSMI